MLKINVLKDFNNKQLHMIGQGGAKKAFLQFFGRKGG